MLLSVFTPTNSVQYLSETYDSLRTQRHRDWEWLLLPNGEAIGQIPEAIRKDPRVRVLSPLTDAKPLIGALKRSCCDQAKGDAFVELDHDDILLPNALYDVATQIEHGAGFVYSDAALFHDDKNTGQTFDCDYGWETYEIEVYGHTLLATRAFPITPRSLCEVFYAPDHVRCWTREAYQQAGGHDKTMFVGDDHDLLCRTYLAGVHFAHTGSCTYLYRLHKTNTIYKHNAEIQAQQAKNRDKYIYQLIEFWCHDAGLGFFDLGASGWKYKNQSVLLNREDNSIGCIRGYHCGLHLIPREAISSLFNEMYRILAPSGWACLATYSTDGRGGFVPSARSYWNEYTFNYFTQSAFARELPALTARFQAVRCFTAFASKNKEKLKLPSVYADLCALKGQRQPGKVLI